MLKLRLPLAAFVLTCLLSSDALATANRVYHEQTGNFVASPTCPSGGADASAGRYVANADRAGSPGLQVFSHETYALRFKVEFQFFTNQARVYYTTDGSNPSGSFGTPFGTTRVGVADFVARYSDQSQGCQSVDILSASIPPQNDGTVVKYVVGAWHSGGGPEVFANSGTCFGCFSCTDSTTNCASLFSYNSVAEPTPLLISEFRLRGPNGSADEFVEIYNNTDADYTVAAPDGSAGYALAASDGAVRFVISNGTVIPARGHFLGVNPLGYTLASYPAGNGTTATGDAAFAVNIPDNAGLALFKTSNPINFNAATRLDAVGHQAVADALYREGAGLPNLVPYSVDYSIHRNPASGLPRDTGDNASDFLLADTNGTNVCASTAAFRCQRLGAPGPENLSSPARGSGTLAPRVTRAPVDPSAGFWAGVNRARDTAPDPANNSTYGTLTFRRTFTNDGPTPLTRLRFRVVNLSTFPAPPGTADLRVLSSSGVVVTRSDGLPATVLGTTLEESASSAQPNGGGFNSSLSAASVTLLTPLAPGASVSLQFRFGVQQAGSFRVGLVAETLPLRNFVRWVIEGDTETASDREPSEIPDTLAPTTSAALSPAANASGWHNADVAVTFNANDEYDTTDGGDSSGVKEITYSASGAQQVPPTTVAGASASFVVSAEGTTTVTYSAKDKAGNVEEAKTVTVRLDKTAPSVHITAPQSGLYLLNQPVTAGYNCTDFDPDLGSERSVPCSGTTPSGSPVDTSSVGSRTFTVAATDAAGNTSTRIIFYHVSYAVALLYDPNAGHGAGAQIRLKVQLRDAGGANRSSAAVAVTALRLTPRGNPAVTVREESGAFTFDPTLSYQGSPAGGYLYRLKAAGLASGDYDLIFMVANDPILHSAPFRIN